MLKILAAAVLISLMACVVNKDDNRIPVDEKVFNSLPKEDQDNILSVFRVDSNDHQAASVALYVGLVGNEAIFLSPHDTINYASCPSVGIYPSPLHKKLYGKVLACKKIIYPLKNNPTPSVPGQAAMMSGTQIIDNMSLSSVELNSDEKNDFLELTPIKIRKSEAVTSTLQWQNVYQIGYNFSRYKEYPILNNQCKASTNVQVLPSFFGGDSETTFSTNCATFGFEESGSLNLLASTKEFIGMVIDANKERAKSLTTADLSANLIRENIDVAIKKNEDNVDPDIVAKVDTLQSLVLQTDNLSPL